MMSMLRQHAATRQLQSQVIRARLARAIGSIRTPRRALLSIVALLLAAIWVGQAVAGIFFREAADPERLFGWLALGLTSFGLWNLLKITFRKPVAPFEWSEAEREWLCASPLSRFDLIRYRVAGIARATLMKAAIFALVMIPDLNYILLGLIGLFLGLLMIEFGRMIAEVFIFGLTKKQRHIVKVLVGCTVVAFLFAIGKWTWFQWQAGAFSSVMSLAFVNVAKGGLLQLPQTEIGQFICWPAANVASIILANQINGMLLIRVAGCVVGALVGMACLHAFDKQMRRRLSVAETHRWQSGKLSHVADEQEDLKASSILSTHGRFSGPIAALVWRQFNGVRTYATTVFVSLAVPVALAVMPAFGNQTGWPMIQGLLMTLIVWSFLLLPTALKFDFRRDLDRINVLKSLPVSPFKISFAQLVVPVTMTLLFQLTTLAMAMCVNPYSPWYLLVAIVVLLPFNVFAYAFENSLFLLYPYRVSEEGVQMFLRAILAFTAKGIIIAIVAALGLLIYLASILLARFLPTAFGHGSHVASLCLFVLLAGIVGVIASWLSIRFLARTFRRLDPSIDLCAVQS